MQKRIEWGLLGGRLILGIIMLAHGVQKLGNMEAAIQTFNKIGQPASLAYVAAVTEAIGGGFLILGILVVPSAVILGLTMIGAIILAKLPSGLIGGFELPLSLLGLSLILAVTDSRKLSLSQLIHSKKPSRIK
ncbi:DoxX family protein [Halobacillus litoralis]|uniref:DoxX family protein n=1 Tax=Halobacillus litoralis TaxID=45668 RepID=UPI001CFC4E12|nr:DoxX family protein [Halobacillus litoralis]